MRNMLASLSVTATVVLALVISIASCDTPGGSASAQGAQELVGVATVTDGDTIEIHGRAVRLDGIDAPERGKRCGNVNVYQRASLALSDVTARNSVRCALTGARTYDREVGRCFVGDRDIAAAVVEQGWARDWRRYSGGRYADEESAARAAGRGLWGLECPSDLWGNRSYR